MKAKDGASTTEIIPGWLKLWGETKKESITDQSKYFDAVKELAGAHREQFKSQGAYFRAKEVKDTNRFRSLSIVHLVGCTVILGFLFFACLAIKNSPSKILDDSEEKYLAFTADFIWKGLIFAGAFSVLYCFLSKMNFSQKKSNPTLPFFNQRTGQGVIIEDVTEKRGLAIMGSSSDQ